MKSSIIVALVIGLAAAAAPAAAQTLPVPLRAAGAKAVVTKDSGSGIFRFQYRIANPAVNQSQVNAVEVDLTLGPSDARLSREGLVNGPDYGEPTSEANFQQVPMVPVGMTGPTGWIFGLGITPEATQGYASWGSRDEPFRLSPGQVLTGFGLTSYGLPGVREARLKPAIDYDDLPDEYADPDKVAELVRSLFFRTKTVAPKAPPANFVPLEFLNYLIALLHDSRQQGWVKVDGIHQSLLAKLLAAKRHLEAGRTEPARNEVQAFVNEVSGASCQDFSCPGNKPLTSEAYALLFFNGQYLVERLPAPGAR